MEKEKEIIFKKRITIRKEKTIQEEGKEAVAENPTPKAKKNNY